FRLFVLAKRAVQILPLMLAGMAVGFEALRWLRRATSRGQAHILPHGIGVGAAALLVLGLFVLQDPRLAGAIRSVTTPVVSLEFKLAESARPLGAPNSAIRTASAVEPNPMI